MRTHRWKRIESHESPYLWWKCERCNATSLYNPGFEANGPLKSCSPQKKVLKDCDEQLCSEIQEE